MSYDSDYSTVFHSDIHDKDLYLSFAKAQGAQSNLIMSELGGLARSININHAQRMKKKVLFIISTMQSGGVSKSMGQEAE